METGEEDKDPADLIGTQTASFENGAVQSSGDAQMISCISERGQENALVEKDAQAGVNENQGIDGHPQIGSAFKVANEEVSSTDFQCDNVKPSEGASNDREDISDDELDIDTSASISAKCDSSTVPFSIENSSTEQQAAIEQSIEPPHQEKTEVENKISNSFGQIPSVEVSHSDDGEIIDLKLEDTADGREKDSFVERDNGQRPSGDLEAVSDDELVPDGLHTLGASANSSFGNPALIEGGEDVSSSEDEGPASPDSAYNAAHQIDLNEDDGGLGWNPSEASQGSAELPESGAFNGENKIYEAPGRSLQSNVQPSTRLASLEAEPISDEDIDQEDNKSGNEADGVEAGEVKSPAAPSQPVEELLREVEPISADESSDTDGELPSGDEDSPSKSGDPKRKVNDFESIDSDEGEMGIDSSHPSGCGSFMKDKNNSKTPVHDSSEKLKGMENISDEENLDFRDSDIKKDVSSEKKNQDSVHIGNSPVKDQEVEKNTVTTNFNEHQEELDYEENEGDEGEQKMDDSKGDGECEEGEEGEVKEGTADDKDEGELSDDDCEEGEIKEPGIRKPFIKPICRFFQRGNCTWGINCRFLHPGVNDKGNYQMIEIPGFPPPGARPPPGAPGAWEEPEEPIELPPPPIPDIPHVETAWERGLRIAKEQRKKASERKELEPDFEEKRLNLSVDEERENKENERMPMPKIIVKDPYYDQQAYEEDEYYKVSAQNPWQTGQYENFEVRYNRENSFSPPYREKPPGPGPPPSRYMPPHYSPPIDKFGRHKEERRNQYRPEPPVNDYPSPTKRPDEWTDPWRRSKSPQRRKHRSRSRGRKNRRSVSDSSNSSRSGSSSSGSSRSSRSGSSSGSSSRSRSPEPAPPGVDRHDRYGHSPHRYGDQPRSAVSVRGRGGYSNYDHGGGFRGHRNNYRGGYDRGPGHRGGYRGGGGDRGDGGDGYFNNYHGRGGRYPRDMRGGRGRDFTGRNNRGRSPPDRPLPYVRPRPKSASSHSSSSRSRSRSRSRYSDSSRSRSRSRSSSNSSRSSSSSSSSAGSADSEHLYRDLGSPTKPARGATAAAAKKKRSNSHKERPGSKGAPPSKGAPLSKGGNQLKGGHPSKSGSSKVGNPSKGGAPPGSQASSQKYQSQQAPSQSSVNLDRIPHPRESKSGQPPPPSMRQESKYASRNAPQPQVKAKDPLKVVGQKSNIKLTLLPKQQQPSNLGNRPNPLDSPPHNKRKLSERDTSPVSAPPAKRTNPPPAQASALRIATEKAAKLQLRQEPSAVPMPPSSFSSAATQRAKVPVPAQKQASSSKPRMAEPAVGKAVSKVPAPAAPTASATGAKTKKSMSSRREELLKQLKAVEDAIAKKESKL